MRPESFKPSLERLANREAATEYGFLTMGNRFLLFVNSILHETTLAKPIMVNQLVETEPIKTIDGRLAVRNNHVNILANVSTADDLAAVQAGIICALDNDDIHVASLVDGNLAKPFYSTYALSEMGPDFRAPEEIDSLLDFSERISQENRSLLLVSTPEAIQKSRAEERFNYRWHISLFLGKAPQWHIGSVESFAKVK